MNAIRLLLLILIPTSFILLFTGIVFKVQHWAGGETLSFIAGIDILVSLILAFIYALPSRKPKTIEFDSI